MVIAVTILIVVIAAAVAAYAANTLRSAGKAAERSAGSKSPVPTRPQPIVSRFHVTGDTAKAVFAVPLGDAEAGNRLADLLSAAAISYVRTKKAEGLPLDDVRTIEVAALRDGQPETICTVDLPSDSDYVEHAETVPLEPTHDPIAAVHEVIADSSVAASQSTGTALEPVAKLVELAGPTEAHLRSIGVDTGTMSLGDLVLGLLRLSGYDVRVGRSGMAGLAGAGGGSADVYGLSRAGKSAILVILSHVDGSHPELEDSTLARFAVEVAQVNPDQAILVTDKYSPYSMYEREKRDARCLYITRERLQAFVDSFAIS